MDCPQCGRDNRAGATFCDGCGGRLSAQSAPATAFIGRRAERMAVHDALVRAKAGRGGLVLVSGEPGIGKTRLAQESANRAVALGFQAFWGRCLEDPGAPPYWPWLRLLRGWLASADDRRLAEATAGDSGLLLDLLPELGQRLPAAQPVAPLTAPSQARFRLFEAVIRLWQRAALQAPLLLIIDNLHAADSVSLRLLEFLAPELPAMPLLVLGTYRDSELAPPGPLSGTLGELTRLPQCQRFTLTGLDRAGTDHLLASVVGQQAVPAFAAAIHAHSEGNPLFIKELAQSLIQEGLLGPHAEPASDSIRLPLPAGIREVLGQRLQRLSPQCREILAAAAVVGRSFELELLIGLTDELATATVLNALDEALSARLIEELGQPGRYQFGHALIRETLYERLPATQRLQLHQCIGQQLAALHGEQPSAQLPRLAYHFAQAAPLGSASQAMAYAIKAGARADALLAFEEAVRSYELALELQSRYAESDAESHGRLLLALGTAQYKAGEYVQAMATLRRAATLARRRGAVTALAEAALGYEEASFRPGLPGGTACQLLRDAVSMIGDDAPRLKTKLLSALTRALLFTGDVEHSAEVQGHAVALARQLGDPRLLAGALTSGLSARWQPERLQERLRTAREAATLAEQAGDWELVFISQSWLMFDLLEAADMAAMRKTLEYHTQLAEDLRQPFFRYMVASFRAMLALLEGRFDASERLARDALALGQRQGLDADGIFSLQMFSIERERGRLGLIAPLLEHFLASARADAVWRPGLAMLYIELGRLEAARTEFEALAANNFVAVPRDGLWITCLAYLAEICAALDDADRAASLYHYLLPYSGHNVVTGNNVAFLGAADRYLGLLAATRGESATAAQHFQAALALDHRTGARPYLARTQYHYAALQLGETSGDRAAAAALLGEARTTARALNMSVLSEKIDRLWRQARLPVDEEANPAGLSRRELDVLRLLAAGCSNREIATRLFVSPNTVANHVRSILTKTGTSNRTEAAAYARQCNLLNTQN